MSPTDELLHDLVDLHAARRTSRGAARARVARVEERVRRRVGPGVSKAVAARALGVSVNTLDKWIARGRVPTLAGGGSRRQVALLPLVDLIAAVETLREAGRAKGVLAAAIAELERQDPDYQLEFQELYGASLEAMEREDLVEATVPDTFGPDD